MSRKTFSAYVAIALLLGVGTIGLLGYRASVYADTVTPGYATARVFMELTVPRDMPVTIKATFTPIDTTTKRYYFKSRTFQVEAGITTINWFIKKIPAGSYNISVVSDQGELTASGNTVSLVNDQINDTEKFSLFLGLPPTPNPTIAPTQQTIITAVPETTGTIASPPVPSLNDNTTSSDSSALTPEPIPSLPTF